MVIATQRAGSTPHATGLPMQMILRCSGGVTSRLHWCYVKMSLSIPAEKQSWCPSHGQGPDIMGLPKCVRSRTDGPEASKGAWRVDRNLTHSLTRPPIHALHLIPIALFTLRQRASNMQLLGITVTKKLPPIMLFYIFHRDRIHDTWNLLHRTITEPPIGQTNALTIVPFSVQLATSAVKWNVWYLRSISLTSPIAPLLWMETLNRKGGFL